MKVYTIGTSTRSLEAFIALLKQYEIEALVDVRRFPVSRFEHFKVESLKQSVEKEGIEYMHIKELGGYGAGGISNSWKARSSKEDLRNCLRLQEQSKWYYVCRAAFPSMPPQVHIGRACKARL